MSTISEQGDDLALQKRIRQAVYDIRYKARKEEIDLRHAYSVYIGKSGLDQNGKEQVQNKLFGKKEEPAESVVLETADSNTYKVRITKGGKSYVAFKNRKKINKARKEGSVEMTGHGIPKGSKKAGTSTVKKGKKTTSLANLKSNRRTTKKYKQTKITSRSKPIQSKPKTVVKTVEVEKKPERTNPNLTDKVKKMLNKEDFLADATAVAPPKNKKIGGEKVDNSKLIKVFPQDGSDPQIGSIKSSYKPVGEVVAEILAKESATPESGTGKYYVQGKPTAQQKKNAAARAEIRNLTNQGRHKEASALHAKITKTQREEFVDPFYKSVEDDGDDGTGRSMYAKWNNVKNRLRSMGLKCNYELEGDQLIEDAVEYFYEQGITEDTIDAIVEEVGLDDFVEFVLDPHQDLVEARAARKAKANAPSYEKVKASVDASDAAKKAAGKGEYSKSYAKRSGETEDSTNYDDKPAKPKAKKVKQVVATPAKKAVTKKKVTAAVKKVKPTAPEKTPTKKDGVKDGLRSKITKFVKKGVERHKTAVGKAKTEVKKIAKTASDTAKQHSQHRKDLVKGLKATPKEKKIAGGIGKAVKKAVVGEETVDEGRVGAAVGGGAGGYVGKKVGGAAGATGGAIVGATVGGPIGALAGGAIGGTVGSKAGGAVGGATGAATGDVVGSAVRGKKAKNPIKTAVAGGVGGAVGGGKGAAVGGLIAGADKTKKESVESSKAPLTEGLLVRQLLEGKV